MNNAGHREFIAALLPEPDNPWDVQSASETLRFGSVELAFAGSCLIVCLAGLLWSLALTIRTEKGWA